MRVWVRYEDYKTWHEEKASHLDIDELCPNCPLFWHEDKPDWVYHDGLGEIECLFVWQKCEHQEDIQSRCDFIPLQFIELSEYDNYTGSEA